MQFENRKDALALAKRIKEQLYFPKGWICKVISFNEGYVGFIKKGSLVIEASGIKDIIYTCFLDIGKERTSEWIHINRTGKNPNDALSSVLGASRRLQKKIDKLILE